MRSKATAAGLLLLGAATVPAAAVEGREDEARPVEALRRRMDEMERRHREEMDALRAELAAERARSAAPEDGVRAGGGVEDALEEYLSRTDALERRVDRLAAATAAGRARLVDVALSGLFAVGGSTASDDELLELQGGGHDPRKRGFSVQNVELSLLGAVDPWLRGEAHLLWLLDEEGESVLELEEAFLATTSLPAGLQIKAGHYFTEFGRLNATHPHSWDFVDQPVVHSRMLGGDGMRAPGARVSWLAPTPFALDILYGVQNANGETMASFVSEEPPGGRPAAERGVRRFEHLVQSARAAASWEMGATTAVLGTSAAWGPNSTGPRGRTRIHGVDVTLQWKSPVAEAGFPFLRWQSEWLARRYVADTFLEPGSGLGFHAHEVMKDEGLYTQVTWGFHRGWTLGARWEFADGSHGGNAADPARDRRTRASLALTHYPSEFSKVRLQVSRDRSEALGGASTTVWLQFEFLLGSHGAHAF